MSAELQDAATGRPELTPEEERRQQIGEVAFGVALMACIAGGVTAGVYQGIRDERSANREDLDQAAAYGRCLTATESLISSSKSGRPQVLLSKLSKRTQADCGFETVAEDAADVGTGDYYSSAPDKELDGKVVRVDTTVELPSAKVLRKAIADKERSGKDFSHAKPISEGLAGILFGPAFGAFAVGAVVIPADVVKKRRSHRSAEHA